MKNITGNPEIPLNFSSRESLLSANSELIGQLQNRLKAKRFRVQDGDGVKLGYIRVLIQALQAQNAILKDNELDEIQRRLELIENAQKQPGGAPVYTPVFGGIE